VASRPLHIGVDGRELVGQPTGVGRYLDAVLDQWTADASFPHRLTVFLPEGARRAPREDTARVAWRALPGANAGTWWEQTTLRSAANSAALDVFFAAGYTAPLRLSAPLVVALYDVSFFAHPEWFGASEGRRRRWLSRSAARRAGRIVTISEFSAAEIVRWIGVPRARIVLAPPGAPALVPGASLASRPPVVLFVGSLFARRRIPELIAAFGQVHARVPDARLVLVGANRTQPPIDPRSLAASAGVANRVEWREYVDDVELERLYAHAQVFAFLSDYEGFGMTPLEAIAHGVPPVVLDTPVSREIFGSAARFVSPAPADIANALAELLTDTSAAASLAAAGRACLTHFSWARSAEVIRQALEAAAG
jgi:glycosyltransferase involved in cell wall biosynthesis